MSGAFFSSLIILVLFGNFVAKGLVDEAAGVILWLVLMWMFVGYMEDHK